MGMSRSQWKSSWQKSTNVTDGKSFSHYSLNTLANTTNQNHIYKSEVTFTGDQLISKPTKVKSHSRRTTGRCSAEVGTASESEFNFKNANTGTRNSPTVLPPTSSVVSLSLSHGRARLSPSHSHFRWEGPLRSAVFPHGKCRHWLQWGKGRVTRCKGLHCSPFVILSQ